MHESASPVGLPGWAAGRTEAGAHVVDAGDRELVTADPDVAAPAHRRQRPRRCSRSSAARSRRSHDHPRPRRPARRRAQRGARRRRHRARRVRRRSQRRREGARRLGERRPTPRASAPCAPRCCARRPTSRCSGRRRGASAPTLGLARRPARRHRELPPPLPGGRGVDRPRRRRRAGRRRGRTRRCSATRTAATGAVAARTATASVSRCDRTVDEAIVATGFPFRQEARAARRVLPGLRARAAHASRTSVGPVPRASTSRGRAAGVFDGYFEQALGPWDVAAGALLVREAGGVVTDWKGDDAAWLDSGDIVAGPAGGPRAAARPHRRSLTTAARPGWAAVRRDAVPDGVRAAGSSRRRTGSRAVAT